MEEDEEDLHMLVAVADKSLPQSCKPHRSLAYCPSMDLVAVTSSDEVLHTFRLNGQRVFGTSYASPPDLKIQELRWKPNGEIAFAATVANSHIASSSIES